MKGSHLYCVSESGSLLLQNYCSRVVLPTSSHWSLHQGETTLSILIIPVSSWLTWRRLWHLRMHCQFNRWRSKTVESQYNPPCHECFPSQLIDMVIFQLNDWFNFPLFLNVLLYEALFKTHVSSKHHIPLIFCQTSIQSNTSS